MYLGQVPAGQTAATWDGSGANWFKIAESGAKFNPFGFVLDGASTVSGTIPASVKAGQVRCSPPNYHRRREYVAWLTPIC